MLTFVSLLSTQLQWCITHSLGYCTLHVSLQWQFSTCAVCNIFIAHVTFYFVNVSVRIECSVLTSAIHRWYPAYFLLQDKEWFYTLGISRMQKKSLGNVKWDFSNVCEAARFISEGMIKKWWEEICDVTNVMFSCSQIEHKWFSSIGLCSSIFCFVLILFLVSVDLLQFQMFMYSVYLTIMRIF
jgi:hypothetical protein